MDRKLFPAEFNVNGVHYSFIHLAPRFKKYPSIAEIHSLVEYAKNNFCVDTNRIYVAGMSLGGRFACDAAAAYPGPIPSLAMHRKKLDTAGLGLDPRDCRLATPIGCASQVKASHALRSAMPMHVLPGLCAGVTDRHVRLSSALLLCCVVASYASTF